MVLALQTAAHLMRPIHTVHNLFRENQEQIDLLDVVKHCPYILVVLASFEKPLLLAKQKQ